MTIEKNRPDFAGKAQVRKLYPELPVGDIVEQVLPVLIRYSPFVQLVDEDICPRKGTGICVSDAALNEALGRQNLPG